MHPHVTREKIKMSKIKKYTKKDGSIAYKFNTYLGVDPTTGKKKYTTRRGFKTIKEANLALSRLKVNIEENGFKEERTINSYEEIYLLWFESAYKNTVAESTQYKTKELFTNHILPAFGSYKVNEITIKQCQKVVNEWCERFVKYRSMKGYAANVFDYAVSLELVDSNPMKKIMMPKRVEVVDEGDTIENFYTKEELKLFLEYCEKDLPMKWYSIFRLLAFSGFRKSEALALTWKDINFEEDSITINKAIGRNEKGLYLKAPKNRSSYRTITIDSITMTVLRDWRKQQAMDYLKLGFNTRNKDQLVFSNTKNQFIDPNKTTIKITKIINENELSKVTTHGLRHTHCSLSFESGMRIEEVKERLGHSDIKTTMNIYTHVTQQAKSDAAEKFAKYIGF